MKRLLGVLATVASLAMGIIALPAPALANGQDTSQMVSSSDTAESVDCHYSTGGFVYNTRYMFDGDKLTLNLVHNSTSVCVSNWTTSPDDARWYYGTAYVKINQSADGPVGVEGPGNPLPLLRLKDRQCQQESATNPGSWASVPYYISQVYTTLSSSVTDAGANSSVIYSYDLPCGKGDTGGAQIVYLAKPVEPQVTTAFASASVLTNTPVDLVVTVSNTQVFRAGTFGTFTGLGFTLDLPAGATSGSGTTTCRGGTVSTPSGGTKVQLAGASLGGAGHATEGSCTVTVPVTFTSVGAKSLSSASLSAGATNRGSIYDNTEYFNKVLASVTVANEIVTPSSQTITGRQGSTITPSSPLDAQGFSGPVTYSVSPDLPEGLILDPQTGVISGKPKNQQGPLTYTITASDGVTTATSTVTITVGEPDITNGAGLPDTGTSIRIGLGVLLTGLILWGLAWIAFDSRRRLRLTATDLQVRELLARVNARLSRWDKKDTQRDKG